MGVVDYFEPILRLLPEIPRPTRKPPLSERLLWTGIVLVLYLIMSQIPLYGIPWQGREAESLLLVRIIMASKRGTLMELGIGPLVTSGLIWQLLVGSKVVKLDLTTPRGRALFTGLEKLFAIIFTLVEAAAFSFGGYYGFLPLSTSILVFLQLVAATILVLLMDEMLQKGWGVGSGVSLFIAAGVSQRIFWQLFAPLQMPDKLPLGVIPATITAIYNYVTTGSIAWLTNIVTRRGYPDLIGLSVTILFFLVLVYLENMQIEIPVGISRYGGLTSKIPLKFLYVSNIPIILVSALLADVHIFSQLLWSRLHAYQDTWPYSLFFKYIADYDISKGRFDPKPGTLVYYLTPPRGLETVFNEPLRVAVYSAFMLILSVIFAIAWIETSGMDPWSQAQQLSESGLYIPGFRKSPRVLASILSRYIPTLAILSGIIVGVIAVISDMVGVLGTGIGILLLVGILMQYQALIAQERALEMYPILRKLAGIE